MGFENGTVKMTNSIRFCLVLHNHQPIGNFDHVFEQSYQDSYLPFLEVFESYRPLRLSLHTSGPLMEWLATHHPEYLERLAGLVEAGRIEIVGGPFYEPILTMIPRRDRIGQIESYARWLEHRLGTRPRGMWVPERVWEQSLTSDLSDAGIEYLVLDDYHFRTAGLTDDRLYGHYVTEDDGRLLSVFPGSERLRYLIPFGQPHETIDYLRQIAAQRAGAVVVFGDDGEKFGTWPDTKKHVYHDGWLRRFFDLLVENQSWISTTTLADAFENTTPVDKIYLPDASYREMTEWVLPVERHLDYQSLVHELHHDHRWSRLQRFIRGGFWRNFKVRYPEANEMYARMMLVSRRLEKLQRAGHHSPEFDAARRELYRGQCNCGYWHGAFGGIYLPHLRNAVFNHLIAADNLLDKATGREPGWVDAAVHDYNFDARQEVCLASDKLIAFLAPAVGGHLYELDVRTICHNLLATLSRQPEAYHEKVLRGAQKQGGDVASIHDRVVFKQAGLEQKVRYDRQPRKSLLDRFFAPGTTRDAVRDGQADPCGDFVDGVYEAWIRRSHDRIQVMMARTGSVFGHVLKLTKGVTLAAGGQTLEIAYLLEQIPPGKEFHFGVEFNFAGLPAGAEDRFFYRGRPAQRLGTLGSQLDLTNVQQLGMVDQWLGIDVRWSANLPTHLWTYPIESVSQSEGGFELVHQSVVLHPHWHVRGDAQGRWAVTMHLEIDTTLAEQREKRVEEACLVG